MFEYVIRLWIDMVCEVANNIRNLFRSWLQFLDILVFCVKQQSTKYILMRNRIIEVVTLTSLTEVIKIGPTVWHAW